MSIDLDTVIQRAKEKDPQALATIYRMYYPKMVGVCMKIIKKDEGMVHDLVHDAFVLAFASLDKLRDNERFGEWLTTIVRNVALKHIAQKEKIHLVSLSSIVSNDEVLVDYASAPDTQMNSKDILELVAQLPEGYRKIFQLSVIEGFSHKEIAAMLGIEPHSSSSQLSRAKGMLKRIMKYRMLVVILLLMVSIPLYFILSHRGKEDTYVVDVPKKKKTKKKERVRPKDTEEPFRIEEADEKGGSLTQTSDKRIDSTEHFIDVADTVVTTPVPDLRETIEEERLTAETAGDSIGTMAEDTIILPAITPDEYLAHNSKPKSHKWQLLTAGSLGPALAQSMYKLIATGGDIGSDSPTYDHASTWEEYGNYLRSISHDHTSADTLTLIQIADNNSGEIKETEQHDKPITFGISVTRPLGDRWNIETGLQYSLLKSRFTMGDNGYAIVKNQKIHYLGLPLKLSYRMIDYKHLSAYGSAGLTLHVPVYNKVNTHYMLNWQVAYTDTIGSRHVNPSLQWSTSVSLGLQYKFTPGVSIFVEPTFNWYVPSGSKTHTIWTEHPLMFTSPFGIRITW